MIKSKQIINFNSNVNWNSASSIEIPNTKDIQNNFVPLDSMIIEEFSNININSSSGDWQLILSYFVQDNDIDLVTIFVNGLKTNGVKSINNNILTIEAYSYDIDTEDIIEVHYIKKYKIV